MSEDQKSQPSEGTWFCFTRMAPGVKAYNLVTFYYAAMMTICCYVFINAAQPLVLQNSLDTPPEDLGKATGDLGFYNELLIMVCIGPWGVISDKTGRKLVWFFGFLFMATGIILYPFATNYGTLVGFRLIFAFGAAAAGAMLTSVLADYVIYEDKGKASGIMGLFSGLGALLAALVLLQVVSWLPGETEDEEVTESPLLFNSTETPGEPEEGYTIVQKIKIQFGITAIMMYFTALICLVLLQGRTTIQKENKNYNPLIIFKEGFTAAWEDPRLSLGYASSFVARGDAVVLTTFLSLWIQDYVTNELGESPERGATLAGQITGYAQTAALCFALVAGYLCSRMNSILALVLMCFIALIGYGGMSYVTDPTSTPAIVIACLVGVGEIGVIIAAQSLVSKRAPYNIRGSVGGTFGFCGSIGILVCTKVGGILYSDWTPAGPFVLFAIFNGIIVIWGLIVYWYSVKHGLKDVEDKPAPNLAESEESKPIIQNMETPPENDLEK